MSMRSAGMLSSSVGEEAELAAAMHPKTTAPPPPEDEQEQQQAGGRGTQAQRHARRVAHGRGGARRGWCMSMEGKQGCHSCVCMQAGVRALSVLVLLIPPRSR